MSTATTFDLLDAIDEARPLAENQPRLVQFMIESCELIRAQMPGPAAEALETARRFWSGGASATDLESARVRCWQFLDGVPGGKTTEDPLVCATRAVICLLYPTMDDPFDTGHWFITLSQKAGAIDAEQRTILERILRAP